MELKQKMNAYANTELRMPARYTDMSETEMDYDGAWGWKSFFVCVAVAVVISVSAVVAAPALAAIVAGTSVSVAVGSITAGAVATSALNGAITGALGYVGAEAIMDVVGRD